MKVTNDKVLVYVTEIPVLSLVTGLKIEGNENVLFYPILTVHEVRAGLNSGALCLTETMKVYVRLSIPSVTVTETVWGPTSEVDVGAKFICFFVESYVKKAPIGCILTVEIDRVCALSASVMVGRT